MVAAGCRSGPFDVIVSSPASVTAMSESERKRVGRNVRFDHPSWNRLTDTVNGANAQGMKTNAREVLEALIRFHAPETPEQAAQLVKDARIAKAADEAADA